jgi:protein O-mannosyl-transferase
MSNRNKASKKSTNQASSAASGQSTLPLGVLAGAAIIVIAAFLAYLPSLNGGFVLDDNKLLTENKLVKASDGLFRLWCTTEPYDYWPVTNTTFWIEWRLWGMNPTGYHVTNLLLHIVESLLIWLILRKLSIPGAFLGGVIFALHPVNVESVAWIAQRKNTMAMLFFLLSILFYFKQEFLPPFSQNSPSRSSWPPAPRLWSLASGSSSLWYWLSLAAFLLAMLSKGSVAVLPALLLVIVWWLRPLTKWELLQTAPFFLIAVVLAGVNVWFQTHGTGDVIRNAGLTERLLGAGGIVWFYLYKALLPINLIFVYPQWHIETDNLLWWLPLLAALFVTGVLWWYRRGWSRPYLFAWGFFGVALAPVLGLTDVYYMKYSLVADHYQHIAIIGTIALASAGWSVWHRQTHIGSHWAATAAAIAVVVALTFLTWQQSGLYHDAMTLSKATLEKNPDCWIAHNYIGKILFDTGRTDEAIDCFRQSLELNPNYAEAHNNLGYALFRTGQIKQSIEHYEQALLVNPNFPEFHNNMGIALCDTGRPQEAIEQFKLALQLDHDYPEAHNSMGIALSRTGRYPEAIAHFEQALELKPHFVEVYNNMGFLFLKTGQLKESIDYFQKALHLKPNYIEAHNNLGNALFQTGRLHEAIEQFKAVLQLRPDYINAYKNLALAYAGTNQSSDAIATAQKVLELSRAKGQMEQAKQIEDWLNSYRAGLSNLPNTPPTSESAPPPP